MTKKKIITPPYTPIGDELSLPSTFVQAALALDLAAQYAVESRNPEQLTQIAMVWVEMGVRINGSGDPAEEPEEGDLGEGSEEYPLGFQSPAIDARIKEKNDSTTSKR